MIERINLIEKEAFQFSYKRIMQALVGVVGFCAIIYGFQFARVSYYQKQIQTLTDQQEALNSERATLVKATPTQITEGSNAELQKVFLDTPRWSDFMRDLSGRLPGTVWFTGIKAATARSDLPKSGSSAPNPATSGGAPAGSGKNSLSLVGITSSMGDLTLFVAALQKSPFVSKATLTNSREEESRFTFEIVCDMVIPRQ